ncbi:MAG: hypothetical protein AAF490_08290 [Chloroflexota bacterium]
MPEFTLLHPDTEIIGQMVIDFEQATSSQSFLPILQKYGLDQVNPEDWYSARQWLNILEEVVEESGFINLVSIGIQQIKNVDWPPEFYEMSVEEVLRALDPVYQAHCRGTDTGGIKIKKVSEKEFEIILRVFEPDDLWYGNLHQIVRTFSNGNYFILKYDTDTIRRDHGGTETVFNLVFE